MDISRISACFTPMRPAPPEKRPEGFPGQRLVIIPPAIAVGASRKPITRDLCVTRIGTFFAAGGHFVERPHGTSEYILILCLSGRGSCTLAGKDWEIGPGQLLFLPPREPHLYSANRRAPWTILWGHFRGERAVDYLMALGVSREQPLITVSDTAPLSAAFEDSYHHVTSGFGEAAMIGLSTGFSRLLGLARVLQKASGDHPLKTNSRLLKALALLRDTPEKPWTVKQMSQEAGLSIPHFTELCRRQTGMPPLAYLIRLRLQMAMNLLQTGHHNVEEAARAVGYEDPFYFSRLFRQHLGIPPSACRKGP
jgi:AraC family transcriptional regulator, arabinose operon regulatory protein